MESDLRVVSNPRLDVGSNVRKITHMWFPNDVTSIARHVVIKYMYIYSHISYKREKN